MKRLICLLMCALLLLLLSACGGAPAPPLPASSEPSSLPPALTEDALLLGMKAVLETEGQSFVINYGGQTLVATVMLPASQIGHTGLMAYDIARGEQHWYFELFSLPVGGIAYPNDTTIVAAEEMALHTIDLTDYSLTTADGSGNMLNALTADYQHFAYMEQEVLTDGRMGTTVYLDDPAEPLFTARAPQGEVTLRGISEEHLVFRARGPEGWRLLLVAY